MRTFKTTQPRWSRQHNTYINTLTLKISRRNFLQALQFVRHHNLYCSLFSLSTTLSEYPCLGLRWEMRTHPQRGPPPSNSEFMPLEARHVSHESTKDKNRDMLFIIFPTVAQLFEP
ncbi:hypothetical protein CDAR_440371 [Caerostris darwini]|uniref:Uncharacterized protein n=1 Tax=Caerostris darwini TaxID=1538125 RepID=A0AAV4RY74_9ARAC|nr:hypothetical protein CDAR_440371 [Caerostris darwini]